MTWQFRLGGGWTQVEHITETPPTDPGKGWISFLYQLGYTRFMGFTAGEFGHGDVIVYESGKYGFLIEIEGEDSSLDLVCPALPDMLEFIRLYGSVWTTAAVLSDVRSQMMVLKDLLLDPHTGIFHEEASEARDRVWRQERDKMDKTKAAEAAKAAAASKA